MLNNDGSFYYDDKRFAEELNCSDKTIMRCKRFSRDKEYIIFENGACKGKATKYWILRKPDKKSPFVDITKIDNLAAKPVNLSVEGPQNVTPNNIYNKDINKDAFSNISEEENLKQGIKGLVLVKGVTYALRSYIGMGYPESEVRKILESLEGGS